VIEIKLCPVIRGSDSHIWFCDGSRANAQTVLNTYKFTTKNTREKSTSARISLKARHWMGLRGLTRVKNNISRRCGYHLQGQFEHRRSLPCLPSRESVRVSGTYVGSFKTSVYPLSLSVFEHRSDGLPWTLYLIVRIP